MSRRKHIMQALSLLALVACAAGAQPNYAVLGRTLEPLRSDFNAAAGKVRAVLLVAPT